MISRKLRLMAAIAATRVAIVGGDDYGRAYWRAEVARLFRARHGWRA
jgi:hypothetical protein